VAAPCSDEPRISLRPDDLIKVTRFRNHWLFGERVPSEKELAGDKKRQRKGHIRGWFPRRSAVEVIEAVQESSGDSDAPAPPKQNGNTHSHLKQQQRNGHAKKYM